MRRAETEFKAGLHPGSVLEPIHGMGLGLELDPQQYFGQLETFIDRARKHLKSIADPIYRAELRRIYREVIEDALRLKLEQVLKKPV